MKLLLIGMALGLILASGEVLAFHYFSHNQAQDEVNRMQEEMFRNQQQQDRLLQQGPYRIPGINPC